jgi:hypothetical protein
VAVDLEVPVDLQLACVVVAERHAADGSQDEHAASVDAFGGDDPLYEDPPAGDDPPPAARRSAPTCCQQNALTLAAAEGPNLA